MDNGGIDAERQNVVLSQVLSQTPLGRLAETTDCAAYIAFLASDLAKSVTGTINPIDGVFCHEGCVNHSSEAMHVEINWAEQCVQGFRSMFMELFCAGLVESRDRMSTYSLFYLSILPIKLLQNLVVSLIFKESYVLKFYSSLVTMDKVMKFRGHIDAWSTLTIYVIAMFCKILIEYMSESPVSNSKRIIILLAEHSQTLSHVTVSVIYELFWRRMKYLNSCVRAKCCHTDVDAKMLYLKKFNLFYKNLLDDLDEVKGVLKLKVREP
ncbi:unnamed protein product [Leptosia nina]|uniref:Uncharacterized protein n=1 Tax=Leptosia nina TaxID=320188 RepID=A0AAV1JB52_9NEOP